MYFGGGDAEANGGEGDGSFALGSIIGSGLNAVQIQIMNVIYGKVGGAPAPRQV